MRKIQAQNFALSFPTQQPIVKRMMKTAHKPPTLCAPIAKQKQKQKKKPKIYNCLNKLPITLEYFLFVI